MTPFELSVSIFQFPAHGINYVLYQVNARYKSKIISPGSALEKHYKKLLLIGNSYLSEEGQIHFQPVGYLLANSYFLLDNHSNKTYLCLPI